MELEAEVAKLKDENKELQKKQVEFSYTECSIAYFSFERSCSSLIEIFLLQAEMMEMQKNQVLFISPGCIPTPSIDLGLTF